MAEKQHSAEKDLLRLIENPGEIELKKTEMAAAGSSAPGEVKKVSFFSFSKRARSAEAKKGFNLLAFLTDRRQILRILFLATLCVFIYFVVTVAQEYAKAKNTKNIVKFTYISAGKEARSVEPAIAETKPGAENPSEADSGGIRNIFKADSVKKEEEKKDEGSVTLSDYRLVGISQAADPKEVYAMIKNVKTNITFFLKKEERLDGMVLVNILENKVILKVKGRDVELR